MDFNYLFSEMVAKIEELTAAVKHREEEIAKLEELFTTKSDQLASCTEKLHILEHVSVYCYDECQDTKIFPENTLWF